MPLLLHPHLSDFEPSNASNSKTDNEKNQGELTSDSDSHEQLKYDAPTHLT